ncbi:lysine--tRNA ligase [Actinomadura sp. 9N215]|uniref:lysine--tRNA ligase n=1 Tax=Actinomadura sp. 9N215 TaxID=3375150 RepID=UPI00379DF706
MLWYDQLASQVSVPQVVNDSKTPSGRVHVGSLRGVLIHDAVYRALELRGVPARYLYGIDDYDPLDELPPVGGELFREYLGMPLCNVPAPAGSEAGDLAEYYISEFLDVFAELGVDPEVYRMRDIYRSGRFDAEIDQILRNSDVVRRVDREVANAQRPDDWHPFQVICEQCGRIGTTRVTHYDGEQVTYRCEPNLVKWATGCGHSGRISPFGGNGKLSWKLEWVAKWNNFGVTIEGAGKDHNTRGGSREVAVRCLGEIFGKPGPMNIPYEFFLVRGAKMSSSRGVGVSAREMADLLSPELLRFLMIRSQPKRPVDFAPEHDKIVRLYDDFDRLRAKARQPDENPNEKRLYDVAQVTLEDDYYAPPFDLLLSVVQMPHLDVEREVTGLKGAELTELDLKHLRARVRSAQVWLDAYAQDEDRLELQETLPREVGELAPAQREFLHQLSKDLAEVSWHPDKIQTRIFDTARLIPLAQPKAFQAIYCALLARSSGPKAGNLLAFLDKDFVRERFAETPRPDVRAFWLDTDLQERGLLEWLEKIKDSVVEASATARFQGAQTSPAGQDDSVVRGLGVVELRITTADGKSHLKRHLLVNVEDVGGTLAAEYGYFSDQAAKLVQQIGDQIGRTVPFHLADLVTEQSS